MPKQIDWRHEPDLQRQQFQLKPLSRLLTGHAAIPGTLLVHLGKTIVAIDPTSGEMAWNVGGTKNLGRYFGQSPRRRPAPLRDRRRGERRLRDPARRPKAGKEPIFPEGARRDRSPRGEGGRGPLGLDKLWTDEEKPARKSKIREGDKETASEPEEVKLSFCGRPLARGSSRLLSAPGTSTTPSETYVVACGHRDRQGPLEASALATTEAYPAAGRQQPVDARPCRARSPPDARVRLGRARRPLEQRLHRRARPETGRFHWAQAYEREEFKQRATGGACRSEDAIALGRATELAPRLRRRVVVMPADRAEMSVYGVSRTGRSSRKHGRGAYAHVLGVARDTVIVRGENGSPGFQLAPRTGTGELECVWSEHPPHPGQGRPRRRGRPLGLRSRPRRRSSPSASPNGEKREALTWDSPKREAGDLVVGGGRFFSVSARYAHVYKEEPCGEDFSGAAAAAALLPDHARSTPRTCARTA